MRWLERPGSGPPVVLIHGIPTSPELWRYVTPLVPAARVLAWELVGYGRHSQPGEGLDVSVRAQARHLAAWLDRVAGGPVVLVGHDIGAGVVQRFAVGHPERVAGIVLTDGIAYENWPVWPMNVVRSLGPAFAALPQLGFAALYAAALTALHDDAGHGRRCAGVHWRIGYAHPQAPATLLRQVRALHTEDTVAIAPDLPRLRGIPGIAWARDDRFLPVADAERLARDIGAHLDVIPGADHFTPEDHPERVAAAIRRVLAQAPRLRS